MRIFFTIDEGLGEKHSAAMAVILFSCWLWKLFAELVCIKVGLIQLFDDLKVSFTDTLAVLIGEASGEGLRAWARIHHGRNPAHQISKDPRVRQAEAVLIFVADHCEWRVGEASLIWVILDHFWLRFFLLQVADVVVDQLVYAVDRVASVMLGLLVRLHALERSIVHPD